MRFAYIDSNGNEVPIPSVDALALRIELGAISENTQLYDAQADEWGPAHTHEIYHTLSRSSGSDTFVAPPPAPRPPPPEPPPAAAPVSEEPSAAAGGAKEEDQADGPEEGGEAEPKTAADFGLTLAEPTPPPETAVQDRDDSNFGLDLAPEQPRRAPAAPEGKSLSGDVDAVDLSDLEPESDEEGPAFDFGAMDGGLDFEEAFDQDDGDTPMDFGPVTLPDVSGAPESEGEGSPSLMGLETSAHFDPGTFETPPDSLELEPPASQFASDEPPSWLEETGGGDDGDVLDLSSIGTSTEAPPRERRPSADRPPAPKRRRRRSLTGPLVTAVVIVAGGVGAYAAWPLIQARLDASREPEVQPIVLPDLAPELMPQMTDAAQASLAAIFADIRGDWVSAGGLEMPPRDWLGGVYLASASRYGEVEVFWSGMRDYLDAVRAIDVATFDEAFQAEMARRDVSDEDAAAMRARADSGFVAAADAREATYGQIEAVIDAAIRLHRFLEANEANIEHAPAASVTTDPVLEVRPATEEIGAAMGELIDDVTAGLAALQYREQVSSTGLWAAVLDRLQESGIQ